MRAGSVPGLIASVLSLAVWAEGAQSQEEPLTLAPLPEVKLSEQPPVTEREAAEIRDLIRKLAETSEPDYGLSPTMQGEYFAPIPDSGKFGGGLVFIDHGLRSTEALRKLVELGPRAMPYLLAALDDATPSKLTVKGMMWMAFERRLPYNRLNAEEAKVIGAMPGAEFGPESPEAYALKVGDICFVILGQITNRGYTAARYQPSGGVVINSPVRSKEMAEAIRKLWGEGDHRQKLWRFLLTDFCVRGGDTGNIPEPQAAMRLLYYFPAEAAPLVADVLRKPKVTREFVRAVSWTTDEKLRAEFVEILRKTADGKVVLEMLKGLDRKHDPLVLEKLRACIAALPRADEVTQSLPGYELLVALGERFPGEARGVFSDYLKVDSVPRRRTLCRVLRETRGELAVAILGPLLKDKRPTNCDDYGVIPGKNEPRADVRVCDEAAMTIVRQNKGLTFELTGPHENLDRQIEAIIRNLPQ